MKKLLSLIAAGLALTGSIFAEIPEFTDGQAFVIDSTKVSGTIKDNVKITNVSSAAANFDITVYAYDENAKNWIVFGNGHLKGLADTDTIKSVNKKLIKLGNYKYFAIKNSTDNLKVVGGENLTSAASFRILAYNDENEEKKTGTIAILKGAKSSETYKTTARGEKFNTYHYIKIISREEKDFRYTANVEHNDLVLTISEK